MIDLVFYQAKSRLTNSNLPRPHAHKQQPNLQANFTDLETSILLQVQHKSHPSPEKKYQVVLSN